jgi:hypothetical protein
MTEGMTMIERVARALCRVYDRQEKADGRLGGALVAYNAGVDMTISFWDDMARATFEAIEQAGFVIVPREPTEGMLAAGMREIDVPTYGHVERCFTAMISSALSETSGGEG